MLGKLRVSQLNCLAGNNSVEQISSSMDQLQRHPIEQMPWPEFSYRPKVSFSIAYCEDAILLKYFILENYLRAFWQTSNSPVFEDCCVEFFISFDQQEEYYNLEFNCIGTCLFAFGNNNSGRQFFTEEVISKIRRLSTIKSLVADEGRGVSWELTVVLPFEIFSYHKITSLKDRSCSGNFYKCGDLLPEPHYLSWNLVKSASPDFHLPAFFGNIHFE